MEILAADIALGGDIKNVVHREDFTWPEIILMRDQHGVASVTDIVIVGEKETPEWDELERLRTTYGRKFVRVFGRSANRLPWKPPAEVPRWDDEVEVVVRKRRPRAAQTEQQRRDHAAWQMGGEPPKPKPDEDDEDDGEEAPGPDDGVEDEAAKAALMAGSVTERRARRGKEA